MSLGFYSPFSNLIDDLTTPYAIYIDGANHGSGAGEGGNKVAAAARPPRKNWTPSEIWGGPRLDIHEHHDKFTVTAEIPGVAKEDISLEVDDKKRRVTVQGAFKNEYSSDASSSDVKARQAKAEGKVAHPLLLERHYGSFSRSFALPPTANLNAVSAKYENGLLKLEIAKKDKEEASKPRSIAISS
ncbi:Molecular chaperone (small heat-shock protein Hsp26/Hsp42) [Ceraceosorus bombacis]|uniref:Molecular chaperone (Small heat-shock protein Hsp26/Hsp42) n=1 Tax=Ceraceosorus bombacis TaxID=401625 RepID=A0A0P1BCS4_9BASI|nr:Molecular chaperone (small heat-shock protein Hsp26/Hsp42) [Ceraceosorus bombacis]